MFIGSPDGSTNKHPETHDIVPGSDWNEGVRVGDDGRFLVERLVPGLKYSATARSGFEAFGELFIDVTVAIRRDQRPGRPQGPIIQERRRMTGDKWISFAIRPLHGRYKRRYDRKRGHRVSTE